MLPFAARGETASPDLAPPTFSERMTVRETEILVERPPGVRAPRASDLKVLVDGRRRTVARVESADDDSPWNLVLYVDRELASPGTLFSSLIALAVQAETLTGLGSVEVLDADSGLPLVAPTRDARAVRWALGELAGEARLARDRTEAEQRSKPFGEKAKLGALSLDTAGRRLDRLVARLAERRASGPRALFLIADGADPELAPPFERAARLLAGYAWVTFPVLIHKEMDRTEELSGQTGLELFRRSSDGAAKNSMSIPPMFPGKPVAPTTLTIPGVVELLFDPEVAGFRALAKETAGAVIGREGQLAPALGRLGRRLRVWIDEEDPAVREGGGRKAATAQNAKPEAEPGRLRRLEVVRIKSDLSLRASAYLRDSTPAELTALRLRLLLAGEETSGDLKLQAERGADPRAGGAKPAGTVRLAFERKPATEDETDRPAPVRVTWAWTAPDGEVETRSRLFSGEKLQEGEAPPRTWAQTLPLDLPAGVRKVAIAVDDLASQSWGSVELDPIEPLPR